MQRAELPEAVLGDEVAAAAARLGEHDARAAEAQQAETAKRAREMESVAQAQLAEAAERARRAEAPVIRLLLAAPGGGGALMGRAALAVPQPTAPGLSRRLRCALGTRQYAT